jgi:UDP-glucose:(heptosyl)LPS alpha-1,3-glucosyltransferase
VSFALAARRAVRNGGYDVVQSHERCLTQDIYRAGEGTHRGYLRAMGRGRAPANPYHRAILILEQRIFSLRAARHIAAISRRDKAEIETLYGTPADRVSLVYNGVDLDRFHPDNRARFRASMREALGLSRQQWVVLFVGSGFERKGLGALIDAMARLRDPHCRLVVAGKGDAVPYQRLGARLGLEPRVSWIGTRADVERLYALADVVALPALYEPFGNVHLEALASGVPVLTSARSGGAELVSQGENGWVVAEPTGALVAAGLEALRTLDAARAALAARASAEPFTYAAQVDAFARIWEGLGR